jgi:hypothetical protein
VVDHRTSKYDWRAHLSLHERRALEALEARRAEAREVVRSCSGEILGIKDRARSRAAYQERTS